MDPFGFLCFTFLQVAFTHGLNKTTFTLYTKPEVNWQTAVTFCRSQGQELIRVTSPAEQVFLKSRGQQNGPWYNKNTGQTWSSLYDPDPATPGDGYQWQLLDPSECQTLKGTDWTEWYANEPLNSDSNLCVKLAWEEHSGYLWRTEQCHVRLRTVICRKDEGICDTYDQYSEKAVETSHKMTITSNDAGSCQAACTTAVSTEGRDCFAVEWGPNRQCTMLMADTPFKQADRMNKDDVELYVRRCFRGFLNETDVPWTEETFFPTCGSSPGADFTPKPLAGGDGRVSSVPAPASTTPKESTQHAHASNTSAADTTTISAAINTTTSTTHSSGGAGVFPAASETLAPTINSVTLTTTNTETHTPTTKSATLATTNIETLTPAKTSATLTTTSETPTPTATSATLTSTADVQGGGSQTVGLPETTPPTGKHAAKLCVCTCTRNIPSLGDTAQQQRALSELLKSLVISRKNTTINRRKYSSATDQRPSAQTIGWLGVTVLASVVAVIFAMDVATLWRVGLRRLEANTDLRVEGGI